MRNNNQRKGRTDEDTRSTHAKVMKLRNQSVPRIPANELRETGVTIFTRLGAPCEYAELVVDMLIEANLVGHDSHGIHYVTRYAERIKKGIIDPTARPEVTNDTPSTAIIDGHWTFGQVTATKAMRLAIEKAKKTSISAVGAIHCNHIGRLGPIRCLRLKVTWSGS